MAKAKRYTAEQLSDAEKMAATLANVPEEKRTLVIMMTNSFMAGMEAQKAIDDTAKAAALSLVRKEALLGQRSVHRPRLPTYE